MAISAREAFGPRGTICRKCGNSFTIGNGRHKGCTGTRNRDRMCAICKEPFFRVCKTGREIPWKGKRIAEHKLEHYD